MVKHRSESSDDEDLPPTKLERLHASYGLDAGQSLWAQRIIGTAILAGAVAFFASFQAWVHVRLADRGQDLLVVTRRGTDAHFTGYWTMTFGVLAVVAACVLLLRPVSRLLAAAVAVLGAGVVVAVAIGHGNGGATQAALLNLRIGTGETDKPTSSTTHAYGWWMTLAAGLAIVICAVVWTVVVNRQARRARAVV